MGVTLNVTSIECRKDGECRERQRHSVLQSVWLVVFDAAQCLEAALLETCERARPFLTRFAREVRKYDTHVMIRLYRLFAVIGSGTLH
jgi:hypothetical protein